MQRVAQRDLYESLVGRHAAEAQERSLQWLAFREISAKRRKDLP